MCFADDLSSPCSSSCGVLHVLMENCGANKLRSRQRLRLALQASTTSDHCFLLA